MNLHCRPQAMRPEPLGDGAYSTLGKHNNAYLVWLPILVKMRLGMEFRLISNWLGLHTWPSCLQAYKTHPAYTRARRQQRGWASTASYSLVSCFVVIVLISILLKMLYFFLYAKNTGSCHEALVPHAIPKM